MNNRWRNKKMDTAYSRKIMKELAEITDHPQLGGRGAGSAAEHRAADYLVKAFQEIGLCNVTKDPFAVDSWTFTKSSLSYEDGAGRPKTIVLGGYACNAQYSNKDLLLIFGGKGTEADYEALDLKGKLVLIEINQAEDWWINFPAYEAKCRGAEGVICINTGGFGQEGDNVLVSEDLCGPADMVVFSAGKKDGAALKALIASSKKGEIHVILDSNSVVEEGGVSYNIWGDIPGKTDQVIYVINHYDSYYHTIFDDVQGIGWALGLAKALIENGARPEKTIRFVAHGAEEWGIVDCKYDWAVGAYRQITDVRPEWEDTGFAVINLDGFYAVKGERKFCIVCTHELYDFVSEAVSSFGGTEPYRIEVNMELTSSTEDFSYTRAGIPSFVAGAYDGCLADRKVLHSSDSSWQAGFDDDAFGLFHNLFLHILLVLDSNRVCPICTKRKLAMAFSDFSHLLDYEEQRCFRAAMKEAGRLDQNIARLNQTGCNDQQDPVKVKAIDRELHHIYRAIHHNFVRLDWNDNMIAPHQRYMTNLDAMQGSMEAIEAEDYQKAAEALMKVDFNYYAAFFSEETCSYFERQVTESSKDSWGTGLIENGNENLFTVIRSLGWGDFEKEEKDRLKEAINNQTSYLRQAIIKEVRAAKAISKKMAALNDKLK